MSRGAPGLEISGCGAEAAEEVHRLTQLAFASYGWLTPPSGALEETADAVKQELEEHGGALACLDGRAVGALRMVALPTHLLVRRVAIDPAFQRLGIGTALMDWARTEAGRRGHGEIRVGVRAQLPGNRAFYERLGYRVIGEHPHPTAPEAGWQEMSLEAVPPE